MSFVAGAEKLRYEYCGLALPTYPGELKCSLYGVSCFDSFVKPLAAKQGLFLWRRFHFPPSICDWR
jgi:hypothetical protein